MTEANKKRLEELRRKRDGGTTLPQEEAEELTKLESDEEENGEDEQK